MKEEKVSNRVVDGGDNEGLHSARAYASFYRMVNECSYKRPQLFHLTLTGASEVAEYQSAMKELCRWLRREHHGKSKNIGLECQWRAAVEDDSVMDGVGVECVPIALPGEGDYFPELWGGVAGEGDCKVKGCKNFGLHLHVWLLAEANLIQPCQLIDPTWGGDNRLLRGEDSATWLDGMLAKRGLRLFLNAPQDSVHEGYRFADLKKPESKADALIWGKYIYKNRSKGHGLRVTYLSSRVKKKRRTVN